MCGILGIVGECIAEFKHRFSSALDKLSHRGPDDEGIFEYKSVLLGHKRLSIIDLSKNGKQPMVDDDYAIVFNGEIYNYRDIREFLISRGVSFYSNSDTEVLLKGYKQFGVDLLQKLRGMFAFAIYDKKNNELFLARDRFGKKPLYYTFYKGVFIFASEIKAILSFFETMPDLDKESVTNYFRYLTPSLDKTIYQGIYQLPASCFGILKANKLKVSRYYNPIDNISKEYTNEKEILDKIEQKLIEAVELRLVGDVEVASYLSGGIDSSLVSSIYSRISKKQIHTFSIGYDEYPEYSELEYAKITAEYIGSKHHEVIISSKDFINAIDEILYYLDEPFGDPAALPTYLLSKEVNKNGIKAALSGEGSDEIFFGYDMYYTYLAFEELKSLKPKNKEIILSYFYKKSDLRKSTELIRRALQNESVFRTSGECFTDLELEKLLNFEVQGDRVLRVLEDLYKPYSHNHVSIWYYFLDMYVWMNVLMTKIDRMSMAHSVELRAPMLDHELHELVLQVNPELRISNENKYLLKKIAVKYLPEEIIKRKKMGFSYPLIEWLRREKGNMLEDWLYINSHHQLFREDFLKFLYEYQDIHRYKQHIWLVELFNRWFKKTYM